MIVKIFPASSHNGALDILDELAAELEVDFFQVAVAQQLEELGAHEHRRVVPQRVRRSQR